MTLTLFEEEPDMETFRRALVVAGLLAIAAPGARGQSAPLNPANAKPFLGVWVIEMTEPAVFKGTHTIRVWDKGGTVAASLQTNPKFHVDLWTAAAGVTHGPVFRAINNAGRVWGDGLSPKARQVQRFRTDAAW
jgi:hypothetical protein